ncbi:MAG: VOC family protein [Patescibacteria group bacterium]|nr:VOC family protein [Patescibacteria group bacterium]MDD5294870.1 VOC family protein [Patescibacteria group bacterium]MDD5554614.1 VOC family protein [Patescibacteria group bacterium]
MGNKAAIKHIEFWVSGLKRAMKFYKGVFKLIGWDCIEKNAFSNGQTKIYFIEQEVKLQKTIGPRHICFLASSRKVVEDVANFLIKNKSDIIRGPLESHYKNKSSYTVDFRDPDGYIIEVATKSVALRK